MSRHRPMPALNTSTCPPQAMHQRAARSKDRGRTRQCYHGGAGCDRSAPRFARARLQSIPRPDRARRCERHVPLCSALISIGDAGGEYFTAFSINWPSAFSTSMGSSCDQRQIVRDRDIDAGAPPAAVRLRSIAALTMSPGSTHSACGLDTLVADAGGVEQVLDMVVEPLGLLAQALHQRRETCILGDVRRSAPARTPSRG